MEGLTARSTRREDLIEIARIHKESYPPGHFINEFSISTIAKFYGKFLDGKRDIVFLLCVLENNIVGFALGGRIDSLTMAKKKFIKEELHNLIIEAYLKLMSCNFSFFKKLFQRVKSNLRSFVKKSNKDTKRSEDVWSLLSIAVSNKVKGKSFGQKLLQCFEKESRSSGIQKYRLSVAKDNLAARNFYLKNGFHVNNETKNSVSFIKQIG
jgi:ribosomal protein S18 acetylase RimI-like enzyme